MRPPSTQNGTHARAEPEPPRASAREYALACLASLGIAAWVLRLWQAAPSVPFRWNGDAISTGLLVKAAIESGWYTHTPFLGAPGEFTMYDFPMSDGLNCLLLMIFGRVSGSFGAAMNLYFVLSFPAVAATSLWVMRRRGISSGPAIVTSVLYSLLPAHFLRGQAHLFYAAYYSVPLATELMLSLADPAPPLQGTRTAGDRPCALSWARRNLPTLALAVVVASTGTYMAFFACFLLVVAGLFTAADRRSGRPLVSMASTVTLLSALVVLNLVPSLANRWHNGPNPEVPNRSHVHAETYGLKLAQLVLPISNHRIPALANLRAGYNKTVLINENGMASLGAVGTVGLAWLLAVLLFGRRRGDRLDLLATLSGAAILLATIGGLGSVFALTVSPLIRGYNRISTYIGFFSLMTVAILLDRLSSRFSSRRARQAFVAGLAALLVLGALDQTSPKWAPAHELTAKSFEADREYVDTLERSLEPGTMVFQLPYVFFPEHPPLHQIAPYEPALLYAHSKTLRWSYGAMRGRPTDLWQRRVSGYPLPRLLREISTEGFGALLVDRNGYADQGAAIERQIAAELAQPPLVSRNGRYAAYDLRPYRARLGSGRVGTPAPTPAK